MEAISLKLPEDLLDDSRRYARALRVSRAVYIRRAIERMNRDTRMRLRAERLAAASKKAREESMKINAEFAAIEGGPGDVSERRPAIRRRPAARGRANASRLDHERTRP
jgi:hypothetical protein